MSEKYIGYRPNIDYEYDYESEKGNYKSTYELNNETSNEENIENKNDIEDSMKTIDSLLKGAFPKELKDTIYEIYNPIKDTYNKYLKNQVIIPLGNNQTKYIDNTSTKNTQYGIYLNKKVLTIKKGSSKTIRAYLVPTSDKSNVISKWVSSDTNIAIVDENGCITGISPGNVIIRVISSYDKYDDCLVSVLENESGEPSTKPNEDTPSDIPNDDPEKNPDKDEPKEEDDDDFIVNVSEVSLNRTHIIVKIGQEKQLVATIYPNNAKNKKLIWSSNKNNIATVSSSGIVRGISIGECMITVSSEDGNKTDTCKVTVIKNNTNIVPGGSNPSTPPGTTPPEPDPGDVPKADPDPIIVIPEPGPEPNPIVPEMEFKKNLIDVITYYINSLKDVLCKYYKTLLTSIKTNKTKDLVFLYNNINISNNDIVSSYRHLLDLGLKNEALSSVKYSFLSNNFNINQTIFHLKNFLISYELRKKYESIPYSDSTDISNSLSNSMLNAYREEYSLRYDKAYENLYRYLDSSIKVTNNVVDDLIQGMLAKGILIEKGGI